MSFERDNEGAPLDTYGGLHMLQQQYYSNPAASAARRAGSPAPSSSSPGSYPFAMSMARFGGSGGTPPVVKTPAGSNTQAPTSSSSISTNGSLLSNASPHVARQLTYAQISRQSASPHHHARTAAAMARNAPVGATVTITDPNNPNKTLNGIMGSGGSTNSFSSESRTGAKAPTANSISSNNNNENNNNDAWSTLDMGGMGLKNISPALCNYYTFLTVLYINHNNLTYLTPGISKLSNLRTLDASGNKLTEIPSELGMLIQLRELLLFDNNIITLPTELGSLYQLETLGLEGNPIQADIKNILLRDGSAAVIMSLRESAPVGMPPPQREWIPIEHSTSGDNDERFTVLCYNILCQKYATNQAYGYTPSWALSWDYRKSLIMSEIMTYSPDVVCLQELSLQQYEEVFQSEFRERGGYDSVFYPKSRAKTMSEQERGQVDGCATFFRASKFELVEVNLLEYNQKALQRADFKKCADIYNRVMTKDNIAVMTLLQNKDTKDHVLVANSHIHWDPSFADVKLVQVGMLMDEIEAFASKHTKHTKHPTRLATVIAGDFNSEPESGVYEFLSKGTVKQDHDDFGDYLYGDYTTDGLSHPLALKSSYASIGELPFTNYTPGFKGVLDYIWYTSNTLDVLSLLGPIDQDYLNKVVGFPNPHFPSDHIPILVELKLKPSRK